MSSRLPRPLMSLPTFACLVVLAASFSLGLPARADSLPVPTIQSAACNEMEIVFLIDQSGSMGGKDVGCTIHPQPNDPLGLRFYGPIFAMRWLGNDFLVSRQVPGRQQITYRIAVVSFGTSAERTVEWTTIAPKDEVSWQQVEPSLAQEMRPLRLVKSHLGYTNFLDAFDKAAGLFEERPPLQDGCPRRILMLLTDGEPALDKPGFSVEEHMRQLKALVAERMPPPYYSIYVTGINDPASPGWWARMEPYWKELSTDAQIVFDEDEIGDRLSKILSNLRGDDVDRPQPGPYVVPPYLQEIDFILFKITETEHLEVSDAFGVLDPERNDVEVEITGFNEPIETLRVRRPLPGRWMLDTTSGRADVLINAIKIPTAGVIQSPVGTDAKQFVRTSVQFQLVDSAGLPLPEYADPRYQIQLTSTVSVAGRTWPLSLRASSQHTFLGDFVPVVAGIHTVFVRGTSQDIEGKVVEVINGAIGEFSVQPVQLVRLGGPTFISPTGGGCPLQVADKAVFRYQTQAADGSPVVISLPLQWEAKLSGPAGGEPLPVQGPSPLQGVYTMTLTFAAAGQHTLAAVAAVKEPSGTSQRLLEDQYTFEVAPVQDVSTVIRIVEPADKPFWWRVLDALGLSFSGPDRHIGRDPFLQSVPTEVEVLISQDGKTALDPTVVLVAPPAVPLDLVVADSGGLNLRTVPLTPTIEPGRFRASIAGLGIGEYKLRALPVPGLAARCGYRLPSPGQAKLARVENPFVIAEMILGSLLVVAALVLVVKLVGIRRNPCKGYISVQNAEGTHVWFEEISGRNAWRFRDVPARTGIREIRVRSTEGCLGRRPYPGDQIYVKVWPIPLPGKTAVPFDSMLSPGQRWKIEGLPGYRIKYALDRNQLDN